MVSTPSPPPAPNPYQVAEAQSNENVAAAIAQSILNNVNQVTPYGDIQCKAVDWVPGPHGNKIPVWQATTTLSPKMAALYRSNIANAQSSSELEKALLANAQGRLSQPLDLSWGATEAKLNELNSHTLDPQWAKGQAELDQQLANRGLTPGSEGWKYAQQQFALNKAQAYDQMYLQGHDTATSDIEREYNSPLNALTALRSNAQVSQPGIGQLAPTTQSQIQPPDLEGLVSSIYNTQGNIYGDQLRSSNQTLGGLFGLGGDIFGSLLKLSDERTKTDIQPMGKDEQTDLPMYAYRYKGDPKSYPKVVGPMAQDVEKKYPGSTAQVGTRRAIRPTFGIGGATGGATAFGIGG
jgi:Chaperone of endosialidase